MNETVTVFSITAVYIFSDIFWIPSASCFRFFLNYYFVMVMSQTWRLLLWLSSVASVHIFKECVGMFMREFFRWELRARLAIKCRQLIHLPKPWLILLFLHFFALYIFFIVQCQVAYIGFFLPFQMTEEEAITGLNSWVNILKLRFCSTIRCFFWAIWCSG